MGDYIKMADSSKSSDVQLKIEYDKGARPLVSLPNIILTRINPDIITSLTAINSTQKKNTLKKVTSKNNNKKLSLKTRVKTVPLNNTEGKQRGRPKKINSFSPKSPQRPVKKSVKIGQKIINKSINNEQTSKKSIKNEHQMRKKSIKSDQQSVRKSTKNYIHAVKKSTKIDLKTVKKSTKNDLQTVKTAIKKTSNKSKTIVKPQNIATKDMLKKTMLQKKNKISVQQVRKPKSIKKSVSKQTPVKLIKKTPPAMKIDPKPQASTDSSEDEFLYDELIEEFENTFNKGPTFLHSVSEKTTNITLKPSTGNKPPTIVKGGIIKMKNLPADLKTIASPGQQPVTNKTNEQTSLKRSTPINCPTPSKKSSPWPISISNSPKTNKISQRIQERVNKKSPASKTHSISTTVTSKTIEKFNQNVNNNYVLNDSEILSMVEAKPTSKPGRPKKIGPKQTAKVVPISKTLNEDDNLSDEYTEEETLENLDYLVDETSKQESLKQSTVTQTNPFGNLSRVKPTMTPVESVKDDEDPNIDLLRILTDDSEDFTLNQTDKRQDKEPDLPAINEKTQTVDNSPNKEPLIEHITTEEPKERTIYDLINEVSLERPSWNLHIIPETNAFCIAQVTKGRLGLPTLKKCIELDPVDFSTKVYIHQYHIKRFDGIYDSEDSILALIEEIDSIKA